MLFAAKIFKILDNNINLCYICNTFLGDYIQMKNNIKKIITSIAVFTLVVASLVMLAACVGETRDFNRMQNHFSGSYFWTIAQADLPPAAADVFFATAHDGATTVKVVLFKNELDALAFRNQVLSNAPDTHTAINEGALVFFTSNNALSYVRNLYLRLAPTRPTVPVV